MSSFTPYNPTAHTPLDLISALAPAGIQVVPGSIALAYGTTQGRQGGEVASLSFYHGSLASLGIGAGLLLTSGDGAPATANGKSSYGLPLTPSHDDDMLTSAVQQAFSGAGSVNDATWLQFQFTVTQGSGIQFDLMFGSDEYPEFSNTSFVDIAGVFVNGKNYAFFNGQTEQPLSILEQNLLAGNFRDNQNKLLPIEYDGISHKLTIIAPVQAGVNTLKLAIADTGDQIYDSGLFVANLRAVDYAGAGLALQVGGSTAKDVVQGQNFNEFFDLGAGDDILIFGLGDDVFLGGAGMDAAAITWAFNPQQLVATSSGYQLLGGAQGTKTLVDVELLYSDFTKSLYALDTQPGGNAWFVYAMVNALTNAAPPQALLSQWVAAAHKAAGFAALSQQVLDYYAPGLDPAVLVQVLYQNLVGVAPTPAQVAEIVAQVGPGKAFATPGALLAAAVQLDINTQEIATIVGKPLPLDLQYFVG